MGTIKVKGASKNSLYPSLLEKGEGLRRKKRVFRGSLKIFNS
jgi:hypothetical protein